MYIIQGQWKSKFNRQHSLKAKFYVSETDSCEVQMMYQEHTYNYGKFPEDNVRVLEMFYNGEGISMVIVLPDEKKNLAEVQFFSSLIFNQASDFSIASHSTPFLHLCNKGGGNFNP